METNITTLFNKLESNSNEESNLAKQKLIELFNQTRDSWIVNGIIDYFSQTNSARVVDLLVKVQQQHDQFIFDKLTKMLRESPSSRKIALSLFGHIIRKHPTWIHKVVDHQLMKDLIKLLKHEKDVVTYMYGLLCIISLLPIIPTTIAKQLQDLFDIFNYLAMWITSNATNIPECQLVQLQYNLCTLFIRLYGMFPCNFLEFIRSEYVFSKDPSKMNVYTQVIAPMLDNIKVHPLLVTASKNNELTANRWKKMEPHDVIMECARYSVESDRNGGNGIGARNSLDYSSYMASIQAADFFNCAQSIPDLRPIVSAETIENKFESLWSPSHVILATPNTPTPTPLPNFSIPTLSAHQTFGTEGTSPPETAVEATPETTPMKPHEVVKNRPYPVSSSAARAIWPKNGSQPSSPMKRGDFKYPTTSVDLEASTSQKLMLLVNDRMQTEVTPPRATLNSSLPSTTQSGGGNSPISFGKTTGESSADCSREDQEVKEIINQVNGNQSHSQNQNHEVLVDEEDDDIENGLTLVNHNVFQNSNLRRRVKRCRMYSHCLGDSSMSYSAGTSPADISYMTRIRSTNRLKRFNSWPDLKGLKSIELTSSRSKNGDMNGNNNTSSSPSDEALSAETHFKKILSKEKKSLYKEIREDLYKRLLDVEKQDSATQTIQMWPQAYEIMFYDLFYEENPNSTHNNQSTSLTVNTTTTTSTTTTTTITKHQNSSGFMDIAAISPDDIIDQYIQASLKRRSSNEVKDSMELLGMALQYERYRREIHAERNRRLLPKCRQIRQLEQSNDTFKEQVKRLTEEIAEHNRVSSDLRRKFQAQLEDINGENRKLKAEWLKESENNQCLKRQLDSIQFRLDEEINARKQLTDKIQLLNVEIFDLKNDLDKAKQEAEVGKQCSEELQRVQCEMIVLNEAKLKCAQKLSDYDNLRARDAEIEYLMENYGAENGELRRILELKTSQVDSMRARVGDLEMQIKNRDNGLTEQKRILQVVKDQYEEKLNALEEKYSTQKAIVVRMEEHILELNKNQPAVNLGTSPEDPGDATSPLSLSFASDCQSLSTSLRSTNEIRNLQSLVSFPLDGRGNSSDDI